MSEVNLTIGVFYSCHKCSIADAEVQIAAREAQDVIAWMDDVLTPGLVADHEKRSPNCRPKTLNSVKIPITGRDRVGGATAQ